MNVHASTLLALALAIAPGTALAIGQSGSGGQSQPATSTAAANPIQAAVTAQSQPGPAELYRSCNQLITEAQTKAKVVRNATNPHGLNPDLTIQSHKELKQILTKLVEEHQHFYQALTPDQQNSVQTRNANLLQAHSRFQNLVNEMERELTDSTIHVAEVAEQARATQKEMNSYQKEFRAMGGTLGYN